MLAENVENPKLQQPPQATKARKQPRKPSQKTRALLTIPHIRHFEVKLLRSGQPVQATLH